MSDIARQSDELIIRPLTPERWPDIEQLFEEKGVCVDCWCMWWRRTRDEFSHMTDNEKKQGLLALVQAKHAPGILAYRGDQPVGWCSIGPRELYGRLERSPRLRRIDDAPVWSVVCFFVAERFRRQGVSVALLQGALDYARDEGATIVEGYPVEPKSPNQPDGELYTGIASAFRELGFSIVNLSPLIVRYVVN